MAERSSSNMLMRSRSQAGLGGHDDESIAAASSSWTDCRSLTGYKETIWEGRVTEGDEEESEEQASMGSFVYYPENHSEWVSCSPNHQNAIVVDVARHPEGEGFQRQGDGAVRALKAKEATHKATTKPVTAAEKVVAMLCQNLYRDSARPKVAMPKGQIGVSAMRSDRPRQRSI